ncbi:MAG: sigma 54-interacting transcriptional regulator [Kofleriaceae bacterium]
MSDGEWGDSTKTLGDQRATFRSRKLHIEVAEGPDRGRVVELPGPSIEVGSGRDVDLVLTDPTVSRHHATIAIERDGIRVIDVGSRNGTSVDGVRVRDAFARADSLLVLGNTTLRLRLLDGEIDLPLSTRSRFGGLLGGSVAMRRVFAMLERIAKTDTTVLVEAETGTGKELVAEALHEEGSRASGPFVVFDCSAVSTSLIESELFGHVRGAFTGAVADRAGAFEAADQGTLFLDEIGELPLDLQPKLLRALERLEIRRVGETTARRVDVRIVAATHRSLAAEVDAGRFREDLYYRLAVVRVGVPPLRERLDDIPMLVENFARETARRGRTPVYLPESVVRGFQAQAWPGNVRELRNAVMRAAALGVPDGAPVEPPAASPTAIDLSVPLKIARDRVTEAFEIAYLTEALKATGGNVSRAAELAGVNRKFIQRAMKGHDLRAAVDDGDDK